MNSYGLTKCLNKWCGALFKPGNWFAYASPPLGDTSGARGRFIGKIPDGVCPICRKPLTQKRAAGS